MEQKLEKLSAKDLRKKIYSMILPITGENVLQMLAGFVSTSMIGYIQTMPVIIAVGALGISARITQLIWALIKGITTGASVFVAQAYGAKDYRKLKSVIQQTLLSTVFVVILLQQLVFWKAPMLLSIFNPKPELMESAASYLRIVSWGLPFLAVMLIVGGVLQGMGNAKTPMIIALIMNGTNIVFSYILIFGKFGVPALGIKGAAIGLIIAQFTGAMIGLSVLFGKNGVLYSMFGKQFFRVDIREVLSIYRVGMPSALESIFWQMASIILTMIILSFGETAFAAHQLGLQAESISYMPAIGFGVAATAFIGQAVGAQDRELGKRCMKELIIGSLIITSISAFILIFLPGAVMRLLTKEAEVIKLGSIYLILMGLVQIPQNISGVLNGALRGAGYTRVPMIVAGAGLWGIRIPFSIILTKFYHMSIVAIWSVMCIDLGFRFIFSLVLYKTRDLYEHRLVSDKPIEG